MNSKNNPSAASLEVFSDARSGENKSSVKPRKNRQTRKKNDKNGGFWKRQARTWHWVTGAMSLVGILLFSATGITLNHAHQIKSKIIIEERTGEFPKNLIEQLKNQPLSGESNALPPVMERWISRNIDISVKNRTVEWTDVDAYIALPRPGGDAWLSIDRETGEVIYEVTSRGVISYLNDLHKGRNTGEAWSWFIDIFSAICVFFTLTGLWLLYIHAAKRSSTWPLTIAGFILPALLIYFFIH